MDDRSHQDLEAGRVEMIREGLEHLAQGFSIFDRDLRLAACNRTFLELLDFPDEMGQLGRPLSDLFRFNAERGDYGPGAIGTLVAERMALAKQAQPHCFERVRPNGTVIEIRGQPLPSGGFVTTYTDITERKQSENALQAAREAADESNRAKSDFLNMVSHELRTPLTSIRSFAEILLDNPDVDICQRAEFVGVIHAECERLLRMINELLDFAKIEAGRVEWRINELDPKSLVVSAAASVAPIFEEKQVELALALSGDRATIDGDADRLTQVVVNLLSNACKFAPESAGRVAVGLDIGPTDVTISVADNGPGIPPEKHEEIFQEFRQVSAQDGSHPPGTGLGLAICRRIVEHLGGRIWIEGAPPDGATVRFAVPRRHV